MWTVVDFSERKGRLFFIIKKENMFDFTVHKQG